MSRAVSIRRSLVRDLVVVVMLLSAGVLLTTVISARRAVATLSRSIVSEKTSETEQQLRRFFDTVRDQLLQARAWGEAGLLAADDIEPFVRLLTPIMRRYPQVSSLMLADSRGRESMMLRQDDRWVCRITRRDEWGNRTRWLEWTDADPNRVESFKELDYDPRKRPWYRGAIDSRASASPGGATGDPTSEVHWTEPYTFFTTKDAGITASVSLDAGDGIDRVIAFDILLSDITQFTAGLEVSANGLAAVLTDDRRLIGLPRDPRYADAQARKDAMLKRPEELGWTLALDATRAFSEVGSDQAGARRFHGDGQWYWGEVRPFDLGQERSLRIAILVPEADLLGSLVQMRVWIVGITLAVLAGAVVRVVVLAHRFSEPVEALASQSDRISQGDLDKGEPIKSNVKEVLDLAAAHERMRQGLRVLMKLERDLQLARQIQQSTFPDTLPQLEGFELVGWSEPADETGGDTYDAIGYTYDVIQAETAASDGATGEDAGLVQIDPSGSARRAVLLLADATGHGIGPALSVTQIRAMLRMAVRVRSDLATIVRSLNEQLHADLPTGRFITAWLGDLNGDDCSLTSFSAGQAPLVRYVAKADEFEVLGSDTVPFGVLPEIESTEGHRIEMEPGDIFAVISDGIYEAINPDGKQLGKDRVIEVLAAHRHESAQRMLEGLREEVDRFCRGKPADDDRTVILIKRV